MPHIQDIFQLLKRAGLHLDFPAPSNPMYGKAPDTNVKTTDERARRRAMVRLMYKIRFGGGSEDDASE